MLGCEQQLTPHQFSNELQQRLAGLHSYRLTGTLESSGQSLQIEQWYQAPDRVLTEVQTSDLPGYRFVRVGERLQVMQLASGLSQTIAVAPGTELMLSPLLLDCCRIEADSPFVLDKTTGQWLGSFRWSGAGQTELSGRVFVDPKTALPTVLELRLADGEMIVLRLQSIVLNPPLSEALFSVTVSVDR